ncbi:MAG: BrnT family toxin [Elusimicrobia bacterium]|nr:BrnT family toxin [Elusimicrobiota bacterium]
MRIRNIHWLDSILDKIERKHHVTPEEVEEVFRRSPHVRTGAGGTYRSYGRTDAGRYLFVVFALADTSTARILTARDMTYSERNLYKRSR